MENAGSAAATAIRRLYNTEGKFITIFCGRGNNGGDGFVVARKLAEGESNVVVVLTDGQPRTEHQQHLLQEPRFDSRQPHQQVEGISERRQSPD